MQDLVPQCIPRVAAICEMSSAGINAAWRGALVARDLGAVLRIVHPAPQPRVLARAQASLAELVQDIRARTRVETEVEAVTGNLLARAVAPSRELTMIVLPSTRGNLLREWIVGTPAERLVRLCRCPVLVVKRPALGSYRKVLVPIDLQGEALHLLDLACSLSRGSQTQVLHVLDASDETVLLEGDSQPMGLPGFRQYRAQKAYFEIRQLIAASRSGGAGFEAAIGFGKAAAVVLSRVREADAELTVIGKRRRGLLADYFLGGLTQRVLAQAPSDVLVHPARKQERDAAAREPAADELAAELMTRRSLPE